MTRESTDVLPLDCSDMPLDWWRHEDACRLFSHYLGDHLCPLLVACDDRRSSTHALFTGFLYSHHGIPMWISAGHVFDELEKINANPEIKIVKSEWLDSCDSSAGLGIPVDLGGINPIKVCQDGLDFGFVVLRRNYFELLSANPKNRFLTEDAWAHKERANPEGFYLVGLPSERHELTKKEISAKKAFFHLRADTLCLPVAPEADCPDGESPTFWGRPGAFYGRLVPFKDQAQALPTNIVFMSGGPVFSIERTKDGRLKYYLFGIQSSWLPSSRIIRATGIEIVAGFIDELLKRAKEDCGT